MKNKGPLELIRMRINNSGVSQDRSKTIIKAETTTSNNRLNTVAYKDLDAKPGAHKCRGNEFLFDSLTIGH